MSERMTDSSIAYDWRLAQNKTDATEQTSMAQTRLEEELKRARASEKALADALWDARQYGDEPGELCWCMSPCNRGEQRIRCRAAERALRLAGRLP